MTIQENYVYYLYPKMYYLKYKGKWIRLDNTDEIPEWLEKQFWDKIFEENLVEKS